MHYRNTFTCTHYTFTYMQTCNSDVVDDHDYYTIQYIPPGPEADSYWVNLTPVDDFHRLSLSYRSFEVR